MRKIVINKIIMVLMMLSMVICILPAQPVKAEDIWDFYNDEQYDLLRGTEDASGSDHVYFRIQKYDDSKQVKAHGVYKYMKRGDRISISEFGLPNVSQLVKPSSDSEFKGWYIEHISSSPDPDKGVKYVIDSTPKPFKSDFIYNNAEEKLTKVDAYYVIFPKFQDNNNDYSEVSFENNKVVTDNELISEAEQSDDKPDLAATWRVLREGIKRVVYPVYKKSKVTYTYEYIDKDNKEKTVRRLVYYDLNNTNAVGLTFWGDNKNSYNEKLFDKEKNYVPSDINSHFRGFKLSYGSGDLPSDYDSDYFENVNYGGYFDIPFSAEYDKKNSLITIYYPGFHIDKDQTVDENDEVTNSYDGVEYKYKNKVIFYDDADINSSALTSQIGAFGKPEDFNSSLGFTGFSKPVKTDYWYSDVNSKYGVYTHFTNAYVCFVVRNGKKVDENNEYEDAEVIEKVYKPGEKIDFPDSTDTYDKLSVDHYEVMDRDGFLEKEDYNNYDSDTKYIGTASGDAGIKKHINSFDVSSIKAESGKAYYFFLNGMKKDEKDLSPCSISYDLDGGTVSGNPTSYIPGKDEFKLNNPTKEGYVFSGWTTSDKEYEEGSIPSPYVYIEEGSIPSPYVYITRKTTGNIRAKAHWSKNIRIVLESPGIRENGINRNDIRDISYDGNIDTDYITKYVKKAGIPRNAYTKLHYTGYTTPVYIEDLYHYSWYGNIISIKDSQEIRDTYYAYATFSNSYVCYIIRDKKYSNSAEIIENAYEPGTKINVPTKTEKYKDIKKYSFDVIDSDGFLDTEGIYNARIESYSLIGKYGGSSSKYQEYHQPPEQTESGKAYYIYLYGTPIKETQGDDQTKKYSISYDLDGGTVSGNPTTYTEQTDTFTLNNPTKEDYTFIGWTGSCGQNAPQMNVTVKKGTTGDLNYVANWKYTPEHGKYLINYDLDGGTDPGNPNSYDEDTESFTLKNPTKDGYVFRGWTGFNGNIPQTVVRVNKGTTGDLSFRANWQTVYDTGSYPITYDLDGGIVSGNPDGYNAGIDSFSLINPTKEGYIFSGWTGSNGNDPQLSVRVTKENRGALTFKANWKKIDQQDNIQYSIAYNLNGGIVSGNPTSYSKETNTFTLNNPIRSGYVFLGWTGSNGNTPQTIVSIAKGTTGNLTYTANWQEISGTYTISYNLNGGVMVGMTNPTSYTSDTTTFYLNNPYRTGYTFVGWTGSNGNSPQMYVSIAKGTTGNLSYTANWQVVSGTDNGNGDGTSSDDTGDNGEDVDDETANAQIDSIQSKTGKVTKLTSGKNKITLKFKKVKVSGKTVKYQLAIKKKGAKKWTKSYVSGTKKTFKKLKRHTTYWISVRPYITVDGDRYFGKWAKTKVKRIK